MKKTRPLGRKISLAMIAVVIGIVLAVSVVFALTIGNVSNTMISSNRSLNDVIREKSSSYLTEQSQRRLLEHVEKEAEIADGVFSDFERAVNVLAAVTEQIYNHPELYTARPVALPDAANDGILTAQLLYAPDTDPADPAVIEEVGLLGNVQDTLLAINACEKNMASIYVATESGFMVQADYISAKKFDESGNILPLEAKERLWYQGAARTGEPYFQPVTKDYHTPRLGIAYGVPIYRGDQLMGVAAAGMYLDEMENVVHSIELGDRGNACIVNENGQVLFSTYSAGTFAAAADAADLRQSGDAAMSGLFRQATEGGSGVERLSVDGVPCYVAYAPMRTVGWSMMFFLPQEVVDTPTNVLLAGVDQMTQQTYDDTANHVRNAVYMLLGLLALAMAIAFAVSVALSRKIAKPIQMLTKEVKTMEGDNLDFEWDLRTDEETEMLADSFESMTLRMKDYIRDIETITAENERINTELALAARIQSNMLPSVFPPFPDRKDFDIYASMDAAKEVGGDFYDFFLIDETHLCAVIADVSGKGVPAALFMMACKIMLSNYVMLGQSPGQVLETANKAICATNKDDMFVTVWLGILDLETGRLTAANAGHEYPVIISGGGSALYKDRHGFVIGGLESVRYREYEMQLKPGDKLFVYTDGVPEATDKDGGLFGTDRMLRALDGAPDRSPEGYLKAVRSAVDQFVGDAEQFDDLTMLCLEYRGPAGG